MGWHVDALAAILVAVAMASGVAAQGTTSGPSACGGLTVAPTRFTLVRDAADATKALVVSPKCQNVVEGATTETIDGVTQLNLADSRIQEIVSYPSVAVLTLRSNSIASFDFSTDATLDKLDLAHNAIADITAFSFPPQLRQLDVSHNAFDSVERLVLPDALESLDLSGNPLTSIRGLRLPSQLKALNLTDNNIQQIQVAESDVPVLMGLKDDLPPLATPKCGPTNATVVVIAKTSVCVITNDVFDQLYSSEALLSPGGSPPPSSSSSTSPSDDKSVADSQQQILLVVLAVGSLMLVAVLYIGFRVFRGNWDIKSSSGGGGGRRRRNDGGHAPYRQHDSAKSGSGGPLTSNTGERPLGFPMEYFEDDDVRYDAELAQYRISKDHLEKKKMLARGGFGVVFLAKYQGMSVAVKQLQRDKMRYSTMQHFMNEIRLCASLNHPHIVGFLGVSWSTLHDLAVVIEYMPHGDVYTFLRMQRKKAAQPSRPKGKNAKLDFRWFRKSSLKSSESERHETPTKSAIATDVADALAYLHSQETPIIHRDLKSKNVLLADDFHAKISDFGISRVQTLEETMTREVGTVAWIAPEVLKGARYTEKADIYSFGVFLTELDTCHLPYTIGLGSDKHKRTNTWIASMVCAGVLQPVLNDNCPENVRDLALECLHYDPENRPRAVDILARLRAMTTEFQQPQDYFRM